MKCAVVCGVLVILVVSSITPPTHTFPLSPSIWIKRWSGWDKQSVEEPYNGHDDNADDDFEDVPSQIASVNCPSRPGRHLEDYWRCIWRTSITAMGMEQDRRGLIESYYEAARHRQPDHMIWKKKKAEMRKQKERFEMEGKQSGFKSEVSATGRSKSDTTKRIKRKKRELNPVVDEDDETVKPNRVKRQGEGWIELFLSKNYTNLAKVFAFDQDIRDVLVNRNKIDTFDKAVRNCQRLYVKPGVSLFNFIACLRESSPAKWSYLKVLQDAPYPEVDIPYDPREFVLPSFDLNKDDPTKSTPETYVLNFSYERIRQEVEKYPQFGGADPYVMEQAGEFRYRFDNLINVQETPAWSYVGKNAAHSWHQQDIRKFVIPLKRNTNLKKETLAPDLPQTYPGLGEIGEEFEKLETPMDYKWNKDSGYHAHTRYLIPILDDNDLIYYKSKGLLPESVTLKRDAVALQEIINALEQYKRLTSTPLNHINYPIVEDVPFIKTYRAFLHHYYGVDTTSWMRDFTDLVRKYSDPTYEADEYKLLDTYDVIRQTTHSYVEAVVAQEKCLKVMVEKHQTEREMDDLDELLGDAQKRCPVAAPDEFIKKGEPYRIPNNTLRELYAQYFERKRARAAYSLKVTPEKFPMCDSKEPSPIDIITKNGKKSSLRDYEFGEAGYRLNRFFMTVPNDGTPLLSIGIFKGERLDDSSVSLKGGAIKGQNLTFQYMFLRFSNNWEATGSEHQLDGKGAPMELQLVFTLAGSTDEIKYWHVLSRVLSELFQFRGKVVIILSVLVDVVKDDAILKETVKKTGQDPYLFEPLAQAAYHFRKEWEAHPEEDVPRGYVSQEPTFRLVDFIPRVKSQFYTYRGSLSWPPCFGYVIWSVYEQRLYMSKRQFDQFAKIPADGISKQNLLADNYRGFQQIGVKEELDPTLDLSYAEKLALLYKRTVNRYVLIGEHDPTEDLNLATVDDEGYYNSDDLLSSDAPKISRNGGILPAALILTCILQLGLNF